jgi:hypothetical protein
VNCKIDPSIRVRKNRRMTASPLKIYVAGASSERAHRAIPVIASLRAQGLHITHDWTEGMVEHPQGDAGLSDDARRHHAERDAEGVRLADFVLLLAPDDGVPSAGCWAELGMALAYGVLVVVAGKGQRRSIFTSAAFYSVETDGEAINWLVAMNEGRRGPIPELKPVHRERKDCSPEECHWSEWMLTVGGSVLPPGIPHKRRECVRCERWEICCPILSSYLSSTSDEFPNFLLHKDNDL